MSKKENNIWIFHHYATPPNMSGLTRAYNFSKHLMNRGYKCTVFSSAYLHYSNENIISDRSLFKEIFFNSVRFAFIRTIEYKKSKILRVLNIFSYYWNVFNVSSLYYESNGKPDVIIGSSAHPLAAVAAIKLAKKYGCQSIVEVRDLWPESFVAYGIVNRKNPLLKLLYAGEKWIYKNADKLVFTMEGGKDYIIERGWDTDQGGSIDINKVYHINNGVDLEVFNYNKKNYYFEDEDLDDPNSFKVIYAGSIRLVNNVKSIVEAAFEIKKLGVENIKFIIYGDGSDRAPLEQYCYENDIDNIVFKGFVSKKYIPYILSKSDLNIIHFEQNAIKKYGASLNKMFEYFASGKPTLSDCEFGYDLIKKYKCGAVIDNADAKRMAKEIIKIKELEVAQYNVLCANALSAAKDYDFVNLSNNLVEILGGRSNE
ncbi:MAG: glycosyltransferase family 4 protein [Tissierellia bacterium]|nr:glycosyltransferase family 4 protein [Tissierellia bacterium]